MRAELFRCLPFLVALSASPQGGVAPPAAPDAAPAAVVEGRVINAVTGEPLRKVNLMLMTSGGSSGAAPPPSIGAISDAEGKFRFDQLAPGRYMLSAEKPGFVRQQYGVRSGQLGPGTSIAVTAGEKLKPLEFKLMPQAVISGKVVDDDGDPVSGAMVQVLRQTSYSNRPTGIMGMSTNDVGDFRIANLAPGKYILRAEYRRGMFGEAAHPQAGAQGTEDYVPTFYPGAADPDAASPVTVGAGQEVSGLAIRLRKARVYRVRGKVIGAAEDRTSRIQVTLQPQRRNAGSVAMFGGGGGNVKPDGTFEVSSVQPGSYTLTAMRLDLGRPQTLARLPVIVADGNVEDLVLQAGAPMEISGRVSAEEDNQPAISGMIVLQPSESAGFGVAPVRIQANGTFRIEGVSRDKYYVAVSGLPDGMYVKRVNAGGSNVLESGLDLSQAESAPALEITVSSKAAAIEGVVRNEDKPFAGASVMLLPEPLRPERLRWLQKIATSDQSGRFTMNGVAPGDYRLYAWEEFLSMYDLEPEQLKPYEGYAVKIKVGESAREQVELKLAPPLEP
jgi:hypothetical protein